MDASANDRTAAAWLRRALAFAVVAFVWWRVSDNTADNDLWGHVLYGERMLHLHAIERTDTLSWTAAGEPWINHEVLAELALGLTHRLAGGTGLWLLMILLAAITIGWAWRAGAGRDAASRLAGLALLALSANFIALGYAVRPQLFTYLLFVAQLTAMRKLFDGRIRWGFVLPLLFVVWANTHGGFLAGWIILLLAVAVEIAGSFARHAWVRLRCVPIGFDPLILANVAAVSTLALSANPWSWKLLLWTFETIRLPRPAIAEWQAMPFNVATLPFYFSVLLGATAWIGSRRPRRLWEMAVWAVLAVLAARHLRHAPLFGLASLILLPPHLADVAHRLASSTVALRAVFRRRGAALGAALALLVAGGACLRASVAAPRSAPFRMEVPRDEYPVAAIDYLRAHHLAGDTITFFDWGQQVLWELPENPVSFDGRLDTVYPRALMDAHWRLYRGEDPGPALDLDRARVALLPTSSEGIGWLFNHDWRVLYRDPLATVLVHRGDVMAARPPAERRGPEALAGRVPFPDARPALATVEK